MHFRLANWVKLHPYYRHRLCSLIEILISPTNTLESHFNKLKQWLRNWQPNTLWNRFGANSQSQSSILFKALTMCNGLIDGNQSMQTIIWGHWTHAKCRYLWILYSEGRTGKWSLQLINYIAIVSENCDVWKFDDVSVWLTQLDYVESATDLG